MNVQGRTASTVIRHYLYNHLWLQQALHQSASSLDLADNIDLLWGAPWMMTTCTKLVQCDTVLCSDFVAVGLSVGWSGSLITRESRERT